MTGKRWDAVVVGGGHNGLTTAAYLARAGKSVLVLEARDHLGGAATLEQPFPDDRYTVSPCAYVVGLLDERIVEDLDLKKRGMQTYAADPQLWVPFADGTSFAQWLDEDRTTQGLKDLGVDAKNIQGYHDYEGVFDLMRRKLRKGTRDSWVGESPTRPELEEMLGNDQFLIDILFEASIEEVLDHYFTDQRMKDALFGQGVIGTYAGPKDKGTASVKLMHYAGELDGIGGAWGYVRGGMGMISFAIADAAQDAGAVLATGTPVAEIIPGEGVRLVDGTYIEAKTIVSNADPKTLLRLTTPDAVPDDFRKRIEDWDINSPVVKFNASLHRLPSWTAAPGETFMAEGTVDVTHGLDAAQEAFEATTRGEPAVGFGEIYVQTVHDPSPAPAGKHLLSVFGQYAPYDINGGWDARRPEVARQFIDLISAFAPDFEDCLEHYEVLGAPDIEERVGLTGGHIFQGEVRPDQMWENRFASRTAIPGVYMCGAGTHPAGSVIATNGLNAATAVLEDTTA